MLKVYTSQFRYSGPNRVDITVKSSVAPWNAFAPTWDMVNRYHNSPSGAVSEQLYTKEYNTIVANAYKEHSDAITTLIHSDAIRVLVCFCPPGAFCHRVLLAKHLESLGAEYGGEITTKQPFGASF